MLLRLVKKKRNKRDRLRYKKKEGYLIEASKRKPENLFFISTFPVFEIEILICI